MQIVLLTIGTRMPVWVDAGFKEYAGRLPPHIRLRLREVPAGRRAKNADIGRVLREEGERLLAAAPPHARLVALDREGRALTTHDLANALQLQLRKGEDLALLVGGPEGLSPEVLAAVHDRWSLSPLTFAHAMVRVIVAEQIYRAWSIVAQLPYHR